MSSTLLVVLILAAVVMSVVSWYLSNRQLCQQNQLQKQGLALIKQLRSLIALVQHHRQLTMMSTAGDDRLNTAISFDRRQINNQVGALAQSGSLAEYDRWCGFVDHWSRLNKADNLPTASCFKQHTHLLENLVYMVEDVAIAHQLTKRSLFEFRHVGYLWRELVCVIEYLEQSKVLGGAVIAEQLCARTEKVKLSFLRQSTTEHSERLLSKLKHAEQKRQVKVHNETVSDAAQQVRAFTSAIIAELIDPESVTIDLERFNQLAEESISAINQIFERELTNLNTYLVQKPSTAVAL